MWLGHVRTQETQLIGLYNLEMIQQQNDIVNYLDVYEEILFQKTQ